MQDTSGYWVPEEISGMKTVFVNFPLLRQISDSQLILLYGGSLCLRSSTGGRNFELLWGRRSKDSIDRNVFCGKVTQDLTHSDGHEPRMALKVELNSSSSHQP